jgi:glutathionylspermidine synthase
MYFFNLHPYSFTLDTEHPVANPSDFSDYDKEAGHVPNYNDLWIVKPAYGNNGTNIKIMTRAVLQQCTVKIFVEWVRI